MQGEIHDSIRIFATNFQHFEEMDARCATRAAQVTTPKQVNREYASCARIGAPLSRKARNPRSIGDILSAACIRNP
jgi:hypothetical protein